MSDWTAGDLAIFRVTKNKGWYPGAKLPVGAIKRVDAVVLGGRGLVFNDFPSPHRLKCWCSSQWRKIPPDEASGDIHDWELLLDQLSKPKVEAIKTPAVEWLEQAGPIAVRLNEESEHDGD